MDNIGRLFGQVAAEAGITPQKARTAVYIMGLATAGRSLADTAVALHRSPEFVKRYARDFMIDFTDYRPHAGLEQKGIARPGARISLAMSAA